MSRKLGFHGWACRSGGESLVPTRSHRLLPRVLAGVALASVSLVACGSPTTPTVAAVGTSQGSTGTGTTPTASTGGPVSVTIDGFQVAVKHPVVTTVTSFTPNNGTPSIDARPGYELAVATLTFTNPADRPQLLGLVTSFALMPIFVQGAMSLAVPLADASAFGLDPSAQTLANTCNPAESLNDFFAPVGYCSLDAQMVSVSPPPTDPQTPFQVAASSSVTLTLLAGDPAYAATVSQSAPIDAIKLFINANTGGGSGTYTWVRLS